ncbi:MAG: hypothetical protein ACI4KA_01980, partial [Oscillospiraceae bacterium]
AHSAMFEGKRSSYICLTVFSVIAMYTHNVAMLGTLGVYITMLLFTLVQKDFRRFRNIFICGAISAVVYIPWLMVVFYQFDNVQEGFWSNPDPGIQRLFSWTISSPFEYYTYFGLRLMLMIAIGATAVMVILKAIDFGKIRGMKKPTDILKYKPEKAGCTVALYMLLSYFAAIMALYLFTELVYPFATSRYFNVFSGYWIVIISVGLAQCRLRFMPWIVMTVSGIAFAVEVCNFGTPASEKSPLLIDRMVEELGNDAEFIHYHEWSVGTMSYYFPEGRHYVSDDTYTVLQTYDVFTTEIINIGEVSDISEYTDEFYVITTRGIDSYLPQNSISMLKKSLPAADIEFIGFYSIPETFLSEYSLYRITV